MSPFPDPSCVPAVTIAGYEAEWREGWPDLEPGFGVYVLADPDAPLEALDESAFAAEDERLPYFASLWPSGDSLTAAVLEAAIEPGARVLDLGCGVGSAGLAAAAAGARVTFVDWDARALGLVEASARVLEVEPERLLVRDWRALEADRPYARILGADLLYEARNVAAVLGVLAAALAAGGEAWIADPGRAGLEAFVARLAGHGLVLRARRRLPPRAHGVGISLLSIASARGPAAVP